MGFQGITIGSDDRKAIDRVPEMCNSELSGKYFAYDGEKSLFTVGALP